MEQQAAGAAQGGHVANAHALAEGVNAFQNGQYAEAYALLVPFAEQGELRAQLIMARLFYAGHGVEKNHDTYVYWLQRSADSGDKASKSLLKRMARGEVEPPFELTDEHVAFFRQYGFLHIKQFYVPEVPTMSAGFEATGSDEPDLLQNQYFSRMTNNERIRELALRILGPGYRLAACEGRRYLRPEPYRTGGSLRNLHTVTAALPGLGATIFLDRCPGKDSAIRVVPGSHRVGEGFAESLHRPLSDQGGLGELPGGEDATLAIHTRPGDLLLLDRQLVHAPAVTRNPMRVIVIEFLGHETLVQKLRRKFLHRR